MRSQFILVSAVLLVVLGSCAACRRQAEALPKPPPPPLEYLGEWGTPGNGPGQLDRPAWLATDFSGNVYVADAGSRFVHKFDPLGHPLLSFQEALFKQPTSIAVDRGGAIYVTDSQRGSVFIFLPEGERFREIRLRRRPKPALPVNVAVDNDGNLYVVERTSNQIQKLNPHGRLLRVWNLQRDAAGRLPFPAAITVGPDGFVYVVDTKGKYVEKLTREGDFLASWGKAETELADYLLDVHSGIAVSEKYVFAADAASRSVRVWTLDGQQKLADDLDGRLRSGTSAFFEVALSPRGELLVLDFSGARVLRFRINF